jgi:hypothetical protein
MFFVLCGHCGVDCTLSAGEHFEKLCLCFYSLLAQYYGATEIALPSADFIDKIPQQYCTDYSTPLVPRQVKTLDSA